MSDAQTIKTRVNAMIVRELAWCEQKHGPENWKKHRDWVTEYVVASAKQWLSQQASKGAL
ncbi:MAG: hypothetical protein M3O74_06830 [Pseudomonadota bacterium]|nr:hypothetical protein [Pseudomonadota bacterium]